MTHKRKRLIFAILLVSVAVGVFILSLEECDPPIWAELPPLEQALPRGTVVTPYSDGFSSVDFKQEVVNDLYQKLPRILKGGVGFEIPQLPTNFVPEFNALIEEFRKEIYSK